MKTLPVSDTVKQLKKTHPVNAVEDALIRYVVALNGFKPVAGSEISQIVSQGVTDALTPSFNAATVSVDELVKAFEILVPAEEAKKFGAVFTPAAITHFMARNTLLFAQEKGTQLETASIIDPSAGCGALLLAGMYEMQKLTGESLHDISARLTGVDISADSIRRSKLLFELTFLLEGETGLPQVKHIHASALEYDFPQKYSIILANPPYVRFQALEKDMRTTLAARPSCTRGNFNLYYPFFELVDQILDPAGTACYITPNAYLESLSAEPLREWMAGNCPPSLVLDFGHHKVFDASTYTAITFFRLADDGKTFFRRVAGLTELATTKHEPLLNPEKTAGTLHGELSGKAWHFRDLRDKTHADTLNSRSAKKVSDYANIANGIQTSRNNLYLLHKPVRNATGNYLASYDGIEYEIEPGAVTRCVKVSALAGRDINAVDDVVIYPYRLVKGHAVPVSEADFSAAYPKAFVYLTAIREELEARDMERKPGVEWFSYARSQNIVPPGDKLLTPLHAKTPCFLRDKDEHTVILNGSVVTLKDNAPFSLELLQRILNSDVFSTFMTYRSKAIDGGYYAYQKQQIGSFPLPPLDAEKTAALSSTENRADFENLLRELYGFKPAER